MIADPVVIARDLLRCRSVTPEEGGALAYLQNVLAQAGFTVHRMTFAEPGTAPIENLYARIGTEKPNLVFAGHTDVVPPGNEEAWRHPPFAGAVAGDMLYGRGAVDMKGGIACFVAAALDYLGRGRRQAEGLVVAAHHRRRGERRGQRHHQAAALGGRARRNLRPLHPRRAEQRRSSRRHHQGRPARLAQRHAGRHRPPGPRRLSGSRRQSDPRPGDAHRRAAGAARRKAATSSIRRTWNSPRSMSAIRRSISFPAKRARASTSASTTATAKPTLQYARRASRAASRGRARAATLSNGSRRTPTCSSPSPARSPISPPPPSPK